MATISLSGNDQLTIQGRFLADFADGDIATITFPNELTTVKTGKNGNSIFAFNATGQQCDLTIRLIRASADDKFLNGLLASYKLNPAGFVLLFGTFIKRSGNGLGLIANDTYPLSGGVFTQQVDASSNVEGNTEQSVAVYRTKFTLAPRVLI